MLSRIPHSMPPLSAMLRDLGQPSTNALGRALGVSPSTARRWVAADLAPRPAMVALYWLTRWGRSASEADAHNAATMHAGLSAALRVELIAAQRQIARLRRALDAAPGAAANSPVYSGESVPLMEAGSA